MFAILKREVKAYFQTVTGWLFIAAVLVLYGLYFYVYNLRAGYPYISYSLSAIAFIMLITVPVLTMRSFAEERHSRTDQLILTAPVSVGKVVLGKYFAMVTVFTIDMVIIAITPLLLMSYGTIPLGESYAAVLGFWLYGCACIAVGMFMSSLTESQVISAVLTFVALFAGYMMGSICNLISESGNLLTKKQNLRVSHSTTAPVTDLIFMWEKIIFRTKNLHLKQQMAVTCGFIPKLFQAHTLL